MHLRLPRPLLWLLLLLWTAAIWWLLTSSRVTAGPRFWGKSYLFNLGHAVLFGVEAVLLGASLRPGPLRELRGPWLLAALLSLAYGGLLEWRQLALAERGASWWDVLTNAVGALGLPWALAGPRPRTARLALVLAGAAAAAALATLERA